MSTNYYDKETDTLIPIAGIGKFPADYGTKEEFETKKDTLPDGTVFTTTDEFVDAYTENYSTDEKVIGTWIDGKPLYRTTIKVLSNMSNGSRFPILNIDTMVDYGGTVYATTSRYKRSFPWKLAEYAFDINGWDSGGVHLYSLDSNAHSIIGSGSTVWFEYTKTTDD